MEEGGRNKGNKGRKKRGMSGGRRGMKEKGRGRLGRVSRGWKKKKKGRERLEMRGEVRGSNITCVYPREVLWVITGGVTQVRLVRMALGWLYLTCLCY